MNGQGAGRRHGVLARAWNAFMVVLIFVLVAPPVAAIAFVALTIVWVARFAPEAAGPYAGFASMFGIFLAYAVATGPAALVGAAFAVWQTFIGRIGWVGATLSGLAVGAVLALGATDELAWDAPDAPPVFALWLLTSLAATLAAWAAARSFVTAGPTA